MTERKFSRRNFLKGAASVGLTAPALFAMSEGLFADAKKRPNVIFIITDDQDRDTLGCFGGPKITPNIDGLAADGILFNRAYTSSPVCTPTRYTVLSGQYASRAESLAESTRRGKPYTVQWNTHLETNGRNVAAALKASGYATGMVGKWHIGNIDTEKWRKKYSQFDWKGEVSDAKLQAFLKDEQAAYVAAMKKNFGFDYAAAVEPGNTDPKNDLYPVRKLSGHNMEWIAKSAMNFIEREKEKPFFLYLSTTLLHSPYGDGFIDADPAVTRAGIFPELRNVLPPRKTTRERALKAGADKNCSAASVWLDDGIGAIVKKLDELGIRENTVIFYFSDQEVFGKGSPYERGAGAPTIVSWKGRTKNRISNELVQNIDFAPTIFDLCGAAAPAGMHLDGISLRDHILDEKPIDRAYLYFEIGIFRAINTKKWKYIAARYDSELDPNSVDIKDYMKNPAKYAGKLPPSFLQFARRGGRERYPHWFVKDQLYDLEKDPGEQNNLAEKPEYREQLEKMKALLARHLNEKKLPGPFAEFKES